MSNPDESSSSEVSIDSTGIVFDPSPQFSGQKIDTNTIHELKLEMDNFEYASKFMNFVTDGVLYEIFLRLPDWRSAFRISFVCKRWHSLISHPSFISSFINHHHSCCQPIFDCSYTPYFTILFCYGRGKPFWALSSEESEVLHRKSPSHYMSFIDGSLNVEAWCDDLLLVACSDCDSGFCTHYTIYNPLTAQKLALPEAPQNEGERFSRCAIVCKPTSRAKQFGCGNTQCQYKVVLLSDASRFKSKAKGSPGFQFEARIFCSETGIWSKSNHLYPPKERFNPGGISMVQCNGIVYQLLRRSKVVAAFNLFNDTGALQCSLIDLPADFGNWEVRRDGHRVRLGVVRGRVQLSKLHYTLKIWELNYNEDGSNYWVLKHDVGLNIGYSILRRMTLLGFHPNDENVIYTAYQNHSYEYYIQEDQCKQVGPFPSIEDPREGLSFSVVPIIHPIWPTLIPPLPRS